MVARWKQITSPALLAVPIALAKTHCRRADVVTNATQANVTLGTGASQLFLISNMSGSIGNLYTVEVKVVGNNTPLSVSLNDTDLVINAATNGSGIATSTVNQIIDALYQNTEIANSFSVNTGGAEGTGVLGVTAKTQFSSGLDSGDEDSYFELLIEAATEVVETRSGRAFINRNIRYYLDSFDSSMELPITPVSTVASIKYINTDGVETTATSMFEIDVNDPDLPARIKLKSGCAVPQTDTIMNAVTIDFTAGFGDTPHDVPSKVKQCILFLVAHWYGTREPVISGISTLANKIPFTFETTLNSLRMINV